MADALFISDIYLRPQKPCYHFLVSKFLCIVLRRREEHGSIPKLTIQSHATMAGQMIREESTIPFSKAEALKEYREKLTLLFRVVVTFDSPHAATGIQWIHLEGHKIDVKNAKVRIPA